MKSSKFSDAQKAYVLRQGEEGVPIAEVCRKAGISQATYFVCRHINCPRFRPGLRETLLTSLVDIK